ncbi:hypothetical protein ACFL0M_14135 [Thermodesulfobacteriota bacterium]
MRKKLDTSLMILILLVLIAAGTAFWTGGWQRVVKGFTQSAHLMNIVWLRLLLGLTLGGLMQVLVSHELIAKWVGPTSGLKGILIGSYMGIFMMGGPFVRLPIIASIYRGGAGIGPVIALLTGNVLAIHGLIIWEIPFLGVGIPLARYIVCLFIPPLAGLVGPAVYQLLDGTSLSKKNS